MANLLAHATLRRILETVRESTDGTRRPYAVMADETTDASRTTQLSLCVRYVDEELAVHERFLGLYSTDSTTAELLVSSRTASSVWI